VNAYQRNVSGTQGGKSPKNHRKKKTSVFLLQNYPPLEVNIEKGVQVPSQEATNHLTVE